MSLCLIVLLIQSLTAVLRLANGTPRAFESTALSFLAVSSIRFTGHLVLPCVLAELQGQCNLQHISSHSACFGQLHSISFFILALVSFQCSFLISIIKKCKCWSAKLGTPACLCKTTSSQPSCLSRTAGGLMQPQATTNLKQRYKYSFQGGTGPQKALYT